MEIQRSQAAEIEYVQAFHLTGQNPCVGICITVSAYSSLLMCKLRMLIQFFALGDNMPRGCSVEGPECTVFAAQRILNAMKKGNQSHHYNNRNATKERCILWGKTDENQGHWCRTWEGCPVGFREKDVNGKCWINTGFPWFRQDVDLDVAVSHTEDAYVQSFEKAHCFAQKHGIKNIIMAGGI